METTKEFYLRHIKSVQKMKPKKQFSVRKYAESERDLERYKKTLLSSKNSGETFFDIDYAKEAIKIALEETMEYVQYGDTGQMAYFNGVKLMYPKESKIICDYINEQTKRIGMVCNNCGTLFSRSNAKFPVHNENKKIKHYICSECKFRN